MSETFTDLPDTISPAAREAFERVMAGQDFNGADVEAIGGWYSVIQAIADQPAGHRQQSFEQLAANWPKAVILRDGAPESPKVETAVDSGEAPALPETARLDPALGEGAGKWLDTYIAHADAVSPMTPRLFHESAGLWLVATAIARRLVLEMAYDDVYPNIFVIWIAPTTLYRKTTGLKPAQNLAKTSFPYLLAPNETTPEAFLSDMAGLEPTNLSAMPKVYREEWELGQAFSAQKGWLLDEMSGLLAQAGKEYNAGLIEALLRFYDCGSYKRSTRGQGLVVVRNAYLSMLGASTPAALREHLLSNHLWANGFWPRFAVLTPETGKPKWRMPQRSERGPDLENQIRELHERLPMPTWPDPPMARPVIMGTGVYERWQAYNKALSYDLLVSDDIEIDHRLRGTYGRLPTQVLKIAMILAALDWRPRETPIIEIPHLARAMDIGERWRRSAHRALMTMTETESDRCQDRVLRQASRYGKEGATARDIHQNMRDKKRHEIDDALDELASLGELVCQRWGNPNGGPKTDKFWIPGDEPQ